MVLQAVSIFIKREQVQNMLELVAIIAIMEALIESSLSAINSMNVYVSNNNNSNK
jgi:hypothetical protein